MQECRSRALARLGGTLLLFEWSLIAFSRNKKFPKLQNWETAKSLLIRAPYQNVWEAVLTFRDTRRAVCSSETCYILFLTKRVIELNVPRLKNAKIHAKVKKLFSICLCCWGTECRFSANFRSSSWNYRKNDNWSFFFQIKIEKTWSKKRTVFSFWIFRGVPANGN